MYKKNIIITAVVLLVTAIIAFAGKQYWWKKNAEAITLDGKEELRKLYARHGGENDHFHISGIIRLYDAENKNALKEQTPFVYFKKGNTVYSKMGFLQNFYDGS